MNQVKTNKKALLGIFLFCFGAQASQVTMAVMAYIMQSYSDIPQTVVQTLLVMPSLVGMIYALFVGNLNQKISAKNLVIFSQATFFVMGLIFLLLGGKVSIYVLIAASGLVGFTQGACYTLLGVLMISAVADEKVRATITGIFTSSMSIGGVAFTMLGGVLADKDWHNAYLLFFYYLIVMVLEFILLPNVPPEGASQPKPKAEGPAAPAAASGKGMGMVWAISIHYFVFFMVLYVFGTNVSEYVINTYQLGGSVEAGIATSCVSIGGIAGGALFGLYSVKVLKKLTVPVLMGMTVVGLAIPAFWTTSIFGIYFSGVILGFAMMGTTPYIMTKLHEVVDESQYGKAMSIYSGFMNAGMLVAIYVIAFVTRLVCGDANNVHYKFLVACVGALACFVTSFLIYLPGGKKKD